MEIGARIDLSDVEDGLKGMSRTAERSKRAFFQSLKKPAKEELKEHQRERRGPTGSWPGASLATLMRRAKVRRNRRGRFVKGSGKRRKGRRVRPGTLGRVPRAWKSYIDSDHFKLRNMVKWGAVHDTGGTVGRGARIPARPFAWLGDEFVDDAVAVWRDTVLGGWAKR